ncbi:11128_t:CDS:2 [Entrophospora sp. SA101]|nr:11128_t:CDS:2 [Entrophospora sp. SA101]CAJ0893616.1 6782_t:CDS:2 [Entrophospora sp. SA101]
MAKKLFVVIAILSSAIFTEAQVPTTTYPPVDVPPPFKPEWAIDLSQVPNAPIVPKNKVGSDCLANDPFCDWSCTNCINQTTDYDRCPDKNVWGITYDDDHLKAKNVKATFFIVGSRVTENPDILKRTFNEGHQLGVHTWSHTQLTTQTNEEIIAEIKWTEQIIKETVGVTPRFMRPPYGDIDNRVRGVLALLGYKVVIWDHDTDDWKSTYAGFVPDSITTDFTEWAKNTTATTGHISLEHDLYPIAAKMAIPSLDIVLGANFQVEQVAKCVSESPYREFIGFPGDNSTSPTPAITTSAMTPTTATASTATPISSPKPYNV